MSKVFLIDLEMQRGMLKKHCDQNIGPLRSFPKTVTISC
jgi:hypothetical protein